MGCLLSLPGGAGCPPCTSSIRSFERPRNVGVDALEPAGVGLNDECEAASSRSPQGRLPGSRRGRAWADGKVDADEADAIVRAAADEGLSLEEIGDIEQAARTRIDLSA